MKIFQRAARQLANIRLVRAKTARTRRRDRARTLKSFVCLRKRRRVVDAVADHPD
jgi:hypothetical protein